MVIWTHCRFFLSKISFINTNDMIRAHTSTLGIRGYTKNTKYKIKVTQCHTNFIQQFSSLAAPTWLWGRYDRHNSPPASYVMDFVFRRSDGSHVSIDTIHPSLLRTSSFSSPRWYHLQSLSSDVFLVSPNHLCLATIYYPKINTQQIASTINNVDSP